MIVVALQMDNALIDDRRIHVDFSQSVSKLWSQFRQKDSQKGKGKSCYFLPPPYYVYLRLVRDMEG